MRPKIKMEEIKNIQFKEVSDELLKMKVVDQEMRKKAREGGEWNEEIDKRNTVRIKEIIEQIGWPTVSKVGLEAALGAWLIVQHADLEPDFQAKCLDLMKQSSDDVNSQWVAMLEDRVRVNTGKPQIFGTQFYTDEKGVFGPRPIDDPEQLDERRRNVGFGPFSKYETDLKRFNEESQKNKSK